MERWMGRHSKLCYALLRIVAGILFACHGAQKLFGALGGQGWGGDPMMLAAGVIEFAGGVLVAAGLWTGYAAFIASGQMAAAYFIAHAGRGFWPILNGGELAALYCFLFLYISTQGSGSLSVDSLIGRPRVSGKP
jgi:putative oxidoreductase